MWEGSVSGRRWRENGFDNVTDAGVGVGVGREWWGEEMGALIETHYLCEEVMEQQSRRNEQTWRVRLRAVHALMELERIAEAEQLCVATLTDMVEGPADLTLVARAQTELAKVLAQRIDKPGGGEEISGFLPLLLGAALVECDPIHPKLGGEVDQRRVCPHR